LKEGEEKTMTLEQFEKMIEVCLQPQLIEYMVWRLDESTI
jgi:hypothetical protein